MTTKLSDSETIAERIRRYIVEEALPVGAQLPPERELAEQFGASRGMIREALRELEATGIVRTLPRSGTYVGMPTVEAGALLTPTGDPTAIAQVFEMRILLEPGCAALAAERASQDDIAALQTAVADMAASIEAGDIVGALLADSVFHHVITSATRNPYLIRITRDAMVALERSRGTSLSVPGQSRRALAGHRRILSAIANRDPDWARASMLTHLKDAWHFIRTEGKDLVYDDDDGT